MEVSLNVFDATEFVGKIIDFLNTAMITNAKLTEIYEETKRLEMVIEYSKSKDEDLRRMIKTSEKCLKQLSDLLVRLINKILTDPNLTNKYENVIIELIVSCTYIICELPKRGY